MTAPIADPTLYVDPQGLAALKRGAQSHDPAALRVAAKQFESLFTRMMLKSMREASFDDPLFGSDQQKFYEGLFDDQIAVTLSRGKGLGLADMLIEQLTRAGLVSPGRSDSGASGVDPSAHEPGAPTPSSAAASAPPEKSSGVTREAQIDFVRQVWPAAQAAGRELGIDPRNLIAHAALETGWGRSIPCDPQGRSSFNLFGVKAGGHWAGAVVAARTLEFEGGVPVPRTDRFRAYGSAEECFADYVDLLRNNPRYADALNTGRDTEAFAAALQRGGYATDPSYASKLVATARSLASLEVPLKSGPDRPIAPTRTML